MRNLSIIIALLLLSACAGQKIPDIQYYVLPIDSTALFNENVEVSVSSALQDNRILFKERHQIIPSHYHRWKAPLAHNLQRVLAAKLGHIKAKTYIHFDDFYTSQRGEMRISGYWHTRTETSNLLINRSFEYTLVQSKPGYNALVDTASDLLNKLAEAIDLQSK